MKKAIVVKEKGMILDEIQEAMVSKYEIVNQIETTKEDVFTRVELLGEMFKEGYGAKQEPLEIFGFVAVSKEKN